jgi:GAF domain-containing protein
MSTSGGPSSIIRSDVLALVREVTAAVASSSDIDETLARIARLTAETFAVDECDIYEYAAQEGVLRATATWNTVSSPEENEAWLGDLIDVDQEMEFRSALESREPVEEQAGDIHTPESTRRLMEEWGEKSWLIVPLVFGEQAIGIVLLVEHRDERAFTDEEKALATTLAVPAAIAIHNARLYRRMAEQNRYLSSLIDSSRAISSTFDLDEVLLHVASEACEALGTSQASVYVHDADRDALIYQVLYARMAAEGPVDPLGTVCPLEEMPGERAILTSDEIVIENASDAKLPADRRASFDTWAEKTVVSVPLRFQNERLGILRLYQLVKERVFTQHELRMAAGLGELAGAAIHNAQAYRRQEMRNLELVTLLEASKAMASSMVVDEVLQQLSERAAVALGVQQCIIYEYDATRDTSILRASFATADAAALVRDDDPIGEEYPLTDYPNDRTVMMNGAILEQRLDDPDLPDDVRDSMVYFGYGSCLTLPFIFKGQPLGTMELLVFADGSHRFSPEEVELARALAEQAAAALHNARLLRESRDYARQLEQSYLETVTALAAAMEAKDHYTAEHADMLATMAVAVGRRLGLSPPELRDLQFASVLHDIGKIGIPGHILNKPDKLTAEEFAVMAQHTIIGERIISRIEYLAPIGRVIRAAHERWDGRGYPDGLAGETIPSPARILFVCDAFHAMTSDRPYRKAMREEDAIEELRRHSGAQFDPRVVDAFVAVWPHFEDARATPDAYAAGAPAQAGLGVAATLPGYGTAAGAN